MKLGMDSADVRTVRSEPDTALNSSRLQRIDRPAEPARPGPDVSTRRAARRLAAPRILLVEDDRGVRDATRMLLTLAGFRTTAVASLLEALQEAGRSEGYDLLVVDLHLANGETGLEVIAAVRAKFGVPLEAVLLTGDTSSTIRRLPSDPHLTVASKPIQAEKLLDLLWSRLAAEREASGPGTDARLTD